MSKGAHWRSAFGLFAAAYLVAALSSLHGSAQQAPPALNQRTGSPAAAPREVLNRYCVKLAVFKSKMFNLL